MTVTSPQTEAPKENAACPTCVETKAVVVACRLDEDRGDFYHGVLRIQYQRGIWLTLLFDIDFSRVEENVRT